MVEAWPPEAVTQGVGLRCSCSRGSLSRHSGWSGSRGLRRIMSGCGGPGSWWHRGKSDAKDARVIADQAWLRRDFAARAPAVLAGAALGCGAEELLDLRTWLELSWLVSALKRVRSILTRNTHDTFVNHVSHPYRAPDE
jgi:hypothetical protein